MFVPCVPSLVGSPFVILFFLFSHVRAYVPPDMISLRAFAVPERRHKARVKPRFKRRLVAVLVLDPYSPSGFVL